MSGEMGWRLIGASVRGASHRRNGAPNEDAWGYWQSTSEPVLMAAVADGHGDPKAIRSHVGARLAIEAARQTAQQLSTVLTTLDEHLLEATAQQIPDEIFKTWRSLVMEDLLHHPFNPHEFESTRLRTVEGVREQIVLEPCLAYGSTLLVTLLTPGHVLSIALGDGDLVHVRQNGECRRALPGDKKLIANETWSLSQSDAARHFCVRLHARTEQLALIMLGTDGVSNAFRNETGFFQLGKDLLQQFESGEHELVAQSLPDWLDDFSREGSGDDATLCLLIAPALQDKAFEMPAQLETSISDDATKAPTVAIEPACHALVAAEVGLEADSFLDTEIPPSSESLLTRLRRVFRRSSTSYAATNDESAQP